MPRALACLGLLLSLAAFAQVEPSAPPPPSEPAPAPAASEPSAAEAPPPMTVSHAKGMRLRFGASAGIGASLNPTAVVFAGEGRIGWQLTQMLGAYVAVSDLGGIGIGVTANSSGGSASITGIGYYRFALVGEATFFDRLFVAAGPALVDGAWASVTAGGSSTSASAGATTVQGVFPALNARLGVGFGHANDSGRRTGFNLMLDAAAIFSNGGVTLVPMLMFGFESK